MMASRSFLRKLVQGRERSFEYAIKFRVEM
jgi:hypothetical protein